MVNLFIASAILLVVLRLVEERERKEKRMCTSERV